MGIQINGQTDTVTSTTAGGKVTVTPASFPSVDNLNATGIVTASSFRGNVTGNVNATGVSTFSGGLLVGTGASISSPATNVLTLGTNNSERVRIGSTGSVGIGTNESYGDSNASFTSLSLGGNGTRYGLVELNKSDGVAGSWIDCYGTGGNGDLRITTAGTSGAITFWTGGEFTEKIRITSSGTVGIGTTNPQSTLQLNTSTGTAAIRLSSAGVGSKVYTINSQIPGISNGGFCIRNETDSRPELTINDVGDVQINTTSTGAQLEIDTDNNFAGGDVGCGIRLYHTITTLGSNNALLGLNCATTNASTYRMAQFNSGTTRSGFGDAEFVFYGNGTANADGSWNGGGADYAEYFEWSDGNVNDEDRRGISVILDGNKIREALVGEDPIGVISGNPSMVGDAAWNKWSGKYLRDDYGSYVRDENGERQLNPDYDPDQEYIPRDQRPEWDCVGLMGKLRIRKGQITGSRWIKMRDVSDNVEEWLVR